MSNNRWRVMAKYTGDKKEYAIYRFAEADDGSGSREYLPTFTTESREEAEATAAWMNGSGQDEPAEEPDEPEQEIDERDTAEIIADLRKHAETCRRTFSIVKANIFEIAADRLEMLIDNEKSMMEAIADQSDKLQYAARRIKELETK
jgi:hypothetical protein